MASYRLSVAGQAINLAGVVAPGLAGRIAFDLFANTAPSRPKSDKEKRLLAAAQSSMREARTMTLAISGGAVASHEFEPKGKASGRTFLVVHGWGSRTDYMQRLIGGLRETGARVVGLDLPGHGASSGRVLTVPLALEAIDAAWRQYGDFDAVVGHSFGGFCSAMSAAGPLEWLERRIPGKLVLIAAPVAAEDVFRQYSGAMGYTQRVYRALDQRVRNIAGYPISYFSAGRMLAEVPDLPVLVLHAEDDKEVPAAAARAYAEAGPHVRLDWINGAGHRRIVSSTETIDAIRNFLV